jgi:heptosyltransferase I
MRQRGAIREWEIGNRKLKKRAGRGDFDGCLSHFLFPIDQLLGSIVLQILLVKTSSMGDVIHNLPVASDIRAAHPGSEIDWVVENPFAAIPKLHPGVRRVLPVAIRRWRSTWWQAQARGEIGSFLAALKAVAYDAVIDTQGLLKSAVVARLARGPRFGLDWKSSREPLALLYNRALSVPWTMHAVERNRALAAQALGYALPRQLDYGILAFPSRYAWLAAETYAVLIHGTSASAKLWPVARWIDLARRLEKSGVRSVLPWGNTGERERAEQIAVPVPGAVVPPALSLADTASVLAGARACIGLDTGLTHLAGALKVPTVGIYCATDPAATGLYGCARALNFGGIGTPPPVEDVIGALHNLCP